MSDIIKMVNKWKVERVPRNLKELRRAEDPFLKQCPFYIGESKGKKFQYRDILSLLFLVVEKEWSKLTFDVPLERPASIEHPLHAEGARRYMRLKQIIEKWKQQSYLLILPYTMVDDYQQHSKCAIKKMKAIYLSLANFREVADLRSEDHIYVVAIVPEDMELDDISQRVVVDPLEKLERGLKVTFADGQIRRFMGSLFALLGDHLGQIQLGGLSAPRSGHPDRYSLVHRDDIPLTHAIPQQLLRNPWNSFLALRRNVTEQVEAAVKAGKKPSLPELKRLGLIARKSPFWKLVWFRFDFFCRFGFCRLHVELEGNWNYHIRFVAARYGRPFREAVHERLRMIPYYPGVEKPNVLFAVRHNQKYHRDLLQLLHSSGGQILGFLQHSVDILHDLISSEDLACWIEHLRLWSLLCLDSYSPNALKVLNQVIEAWRKSFMATNRNAQDGKDLLSSGYSFLYPKFITLLHVVPEIEFLGPPSFQDTTNFERRHCVNKELFELTNRHDTATQISRLDERDRARTAAWGAIEQEQRHHPDQKFFGKMKSIPDDWISFDQINQSLAMCVNPELLGIRSIQAFKAFYLGGHQILPNYHIGIKFSSQRERRNVPAIFSSPTESECFAEYLGAMIVELRDGSKLSCLWIRFFYPHIKQGDVRPGWDPTMTTYRLKAEGSTRVVPLHAMTYVSRRAVIFRDRRSESEEIYYYNRWIIHEVQPFAHQ